MKKQLVIFNFLLLLIMTSCQKDDSSSNVIRIAEQFGLAYAPLQIMKNKRFLEELRPDVKVEWLQLGNTSAIREAVLSGDLDAGFMGIPPFLIAADKGMKWKIATGLSSAPLGLVVPKNRYNSLADFDKNSKIALPQPGSIQHMLLTMAAEAQLNNPNALDNNLISLKHPDGMNALLSGAVEGHFTSPPYLFYEEQNEKFEILVTGDEAMGEDFTFIIGAVTEELYNRDNKLYIDFLKAIQQSIIFINNNKIETIDILSKAYSIEPAQLENQLYHPGMIFDTEVKGLDRFISFMKERDYLQNDLNSKDILF